ncbi:MAG: four helix bundle protein [Crocinitomicaceae bacterium]|nr:four helix bundle protein [Crocinitomicaceae bacterium]|tara:strand:+ start:78 stop:449 length:372 start_codon:yes stop_codon:yes gene_type:complete
MKTNSKYNLEQRLIDFAVSIIALSEGNFDSYEKKHLFQQLIRSSTSPSLMYGETQGAESQKDFIHKMSIGLKELRESQVNMKIIKGAKLVENTVELESCLDECSQLVAIFTTSIRTAKKKLEM